MISTIDLIYRLTSKDFCKWVKHVDVIDLFNSVQSCSSSIHCKYISLTSTCGHMDNGSILTRWCEQQVRYWFVLLIGFVDNIGQTKSSQHHQGEPKVVSHCISVRPMIYSGVGRWHFEIIYIWSTILITVQRAMFIVTGCSIIVVYIPDCLEITF